jgi:integrase
MAGGIHRLPASYRSLKPGLHADGGNLYLQVTIGAGGKKNRSYVLRYKRPGHRTVEMGLGSENDVSLTKVREEAKQYRQLLRIGKDPKAERNAERARNLAADMRSISFDEAAAQYISAKGSGWRNAKHADQWRTSLKNYVSPIIGKLPVDQIDTAAVVRVLQQRVSKKDDPKVKAPFWNERTETASRVRSRIELVLGWATTGGYRSGDNCARWAGHLENLLAAPSDLKKIKTIKHQTALPYLAIPGFMARLRAQEGIAAAALEFCVLTGVRSADIMGAKCADVDRAARVWLIPRFSKTGKPLRVPLSDAAIVAYDRARELDTADSDWAFPSETTGAMMGVGAMRAVVARLGLAGEASVHGFRASLRTWLAEQTNFPRELCELALGHTVGTAVEQAYSRGDGLQKRARLMAAWADFCAKPAPNSTVGNVTPIHAASSRSRP